MHTQLETPVRPKTGTDRTRPSRWGDFPPPPEIPRHSEPALKSGFLERATSFLLLAGISPLLLIIAIVVKIDCLRAPVFFRQERVGVERRNRSRNGNGNGHQEPFPGQDRRITRGFGMPFHMWKFRTMVPDAEAKSGPVWATDSDPRITRVGRVLRHLRLDELPQLINVVSGDMSLIGPRPERPFFVEQLVEEVPEYEKRLGVPPGITGLAQVEREYDASVLDVKTKLKYDLFYVQHRSRRMKFKIMLKTIDVMLRGRGSR